MNVKMLEDILGERLGKLKQQGLLKDLKLELVGFHPFSPQFPAGLQSLLPNKPGLLLALHYLDVGSGAPRVIPRPSREEREEYLGHPLEFRKLVENEGGVPHLAGGSEVWAPLPLSVSRTLLAKMAAHSPSPLWLLVDNRSLVGLDGNTRISLSDSGPVEARPVSLDSLRETLTSHFLQAPKVEDQCCSAYILDRLRLECTWSGAKSLLEFPQRRGSARLVVDSATLEEPLLSSLFQELQLLQSLELAVREGSPVAWPQEKGLGLQQVMAAMEELADFSAKSARQASTSLSTCLEEVLLGHQWEFDFTDQLWNLLKNCSSTEDLLLCLFTVMKSIHYGDVRPLVSSSNPSCLGKWVYQKVSQSEQQPLESPDTTRALEMVLEIGMLKVQRNIASIYSSLELASQHMLEPYFSPKTLPSLLTAAHILELAVCCLKLLRLSQETVAQLTRKHISAWTSKMPDPPFTIDIPITSVSDILKDHLPEEWSIKLRCADPTGYARELVYILSKTYFWRSLGFQYPYQEGCYYSTTAHCIQDLNMPPPLAK